MAFYRLSRVCYNRGMKQLEAVIFDADGTILDTRELVMQAIEHVLTEHGYEMPLKEDFLQYSGSPTEETYARFAPNHDPRELTTKHRIFQAEHFDLFDAYEGLHKLLRVLKEAGLKVGICTNRAVNVLDLLNHLGIKDEFDAIMHADLMDNVKPHPEGLLKVCKEMGVDVTRAVMVGDTDADIGAGKAAGTAFTIGLTHGLGTRAMLEAEGADYIVDHLNDILPIIAKHNG